QVIQRPLFDLYGAELRLSKDANPLKAAQAQPPQIDEKIRLQRAAAMNGRVDFMITGSVLSHELVSHLAIGNLMENGPRVIKALRAVADGPLKAGFSELSSATPLPMALLLLATDRRGLGE